MRLATLFLLLAACPEAEEEEEGPSLVQILFEAQCRIHVEAPCVDAMADECGVSLSFDTVEDCVTLFRLGASGCDDFRGGLEEIEREVLDCVASIEAFECGEGEPMCNEDGVIVYERGACFAVRELMDERCEDDA